MIDLILTEVAIGLGVAGAKHAVETARSRLSEKAPLKIMDARIVWYLPRREALFKSITNSDIDALSFSGILDGLICEGKSAPIDCAEVYVQLRNVSKSRVSITGLGVNRHFLEERPSASFLFVPQGGPIPGECWTFAVDLNADMPTIRRYDLVDGKTIIYGDDRYFDCSTIELGAGERANLKFALLARSRPVEVELYLRYETDHETGVVDVPLDRPVRIYPLASVPQESRYRSTYMKEPPFIALESDERFPGGSVRTRWEL